MVGEDQSTDGITSDKLYGIDLSDEGKMSFAVDTEATKPPLLEQQGWTSMRQDLLLQLHGSDQAVSTGGHHQYI